MILKEILKQFTQLIEYNEIVNHLNGSSYSSELGADKISSETIQATSHLVKALLIDGCEWVCI